MEQRYKVFFKHRIVGFGSDFSAMFRQEEGLFYKYRDLTQLDSLIRVFFELNQVDRLHIIHSDPDNAWLEFKSCFQLIEAAGGIVKKPNGDVLLIYRNNIWDLPKGKRDGTESAEENALREVSEETGLNELSISSFIKTTWHAYQLENQIILKETQWFMIDYTGDSAPVPEERESITRAEFFKPVEARKLSAVSYPLVSDVLNSSGLLN